MTESPKHRIALATCNEFPDLNDDDRLLLPAFAELGLEAAPALWNDPAMDWESFESVIIRSTWDYIERFAEFDAWLDRLKARGIRVWNPVATVRENLNKNYLRRFASCGTPTLPTLWLARGERDPVRRILAESDWKEIVVKPAISAGSFRTYRWQREEVAERARTRRNLGGLRCAGAALHARILRSRRMVFSFFRGMLQSRAPQTSEAW